MNLSFSVQPDPDGTFTVSFLLDQPYVVGGVTEDRLDEVVETFKHDFGPYDLIQV